MSVDVVGSSQAAVITDPRIHYAMRPGAATYAVQARPRSRIVTRHVGTQVVVRDFASGVEGSGDTYLDALWAFDRARRSAP